MRTAHASLRQLTGIEKGVQVVIICIINTSLFVYAQQCSVRQGRFIDLQAKRLVSHIQIHHILNPKSSHLHRASGQ